MSSRREVLIRILALLQRKTLIKPKNRTSKCLKRHHLTVRSMKNVAVLTENGAFALFFRPHPGGFDSSRAPTPGNLPSKAKKNAIKCPGVSPGGGGLGAGGIDWCIISTLNLSLTVIAYICTLWPAISRATEARPKSDNRLGGIKAFLGIKRTLNWRYIPTYIFI